MSVFNGQCFFLRMKWRIVLQQTVPHSIRPEILREKFLPTVMFSRLVLGNVILHRVSYVKIWCDTIFYHPLPIYLMVLSTHPALYVIIFSCIDYCLGHIHKVDLAVHQEPQDDMSVLCRWYTELPAALGAAFCLHCGRWPGSPTGADPTSRHVGGQWWSRSQLAESPSVEWHLDVSRKLLKEGLCVDVNVRPFVVGFIWRGICVSLSWEPAALGARLSRTQRGSTQSSGNTWTHFSSYFQYFSCLQKWVRLIIDIRCYSNTFVKLLFSRRQFYVHFLARWSYLGLAGKYQEILRNHYWKVLTATVFLRK